MPASLIVLCFGNFIIGTGMLVVPGMLPALNRRIYPPSALDGCGLRYTVPTRPTPYASIRFLFIGSRLCFHASFRPLLAETPLRFAFTSPPSGCERDFHPLALRHARHTTTPALPAALCGGRVHAR